MIRPIDYIVIFIFSYIASFLITTVLLVPMHWAFGLLFGIVLSYMWDFWVVYEKIRLKMENDKRE